MVSSEIYFPRTYVYTQATEPSDKTKGKLWYNTTDDKTYVADGTTYGLVADTDLTALEQQQLEQNLNILINSASASVLYDYDDMFLDIFSDADGYDGTIDTGNTTALFATDKYKNISLDASDSYGVTLASSASVTYATGIKITMTADAKVYSITKHSSCTATKCQIRSEPSHAVIEEVDFVGDVAIFDLVELSNSGTYSFTMDSGGASYNRQHHNSPSFPYSMNTHSVTTGYTENGNNSATFNNIVSLITSSGYTDLLVQTNAQPITANPVGHQVYCHNSVAGSGSVTYDISFDGGTTWVTDQALNTKNTSVHAGDSMIAKLNLNGTGAGNTAEASDYSVMLSY